jgi:hypothetical protein
VASQSCDGRLILTPRHTREAPPEIALGGAFSIRPRALSTYFSRACFFSLILYSEMTFAS